MEQIDYGKIYSGFEFSLGWFIQFSASVPYLSNPDRMLVLSKEEMQERLMPLYALYRDLHSLVKLQGGLEFTEAQEQESDTSEQAQANE